MLRKIPGIDQLSAQYGERFATVFVDAETGVLPDIAEGVSINGLIDCKNKVTIEKDVFAGHDIMILTGTHDYRVFGEARRLSTITKPVHIKEGAWLGTRCIILPGVTIGEHAVIGAGAIVTKDILAYEVWAGSPARKIKDIPHGLV
mgnify:CR=1 FL=1